MKVDFDSSAPVKIYVTEAHSERARREVQLVQQLPLTWLHTLGVDNALRVLAGRRVRTSAETRALLDQFEDDRQAQWLADVALDWLKVLHEAAQLSRRHAEKLLCRSLGILPVAAAVEIGCSQLVSADERQLALARAAGLKPVDIRQAK